MESLQEFNKRKGIVTISYKEAPTMTDPKEHEDEEIDTQEEDRDNDYEYYNERESNFNNIWK